MAILKNVTISDVGFERIPQGTTGQRPTTNFVTLNSGINGGLSIARDGLQLYIPYPGSIWNVYQNLPDYLKGLLTTISINDGVGSFTFTVPMRVYQLYNPVSPWGLPSTGLLSTTVESGKQYISGYSSNISVYSQDYAAGTYNFASSSAMYLFSPIAVQANPQGATTYAGAIRFNTTNQVTEVYNGAEWRPMNDSVTIATGGTISGASIGGYKIHTFTSNGTFTPTYSGAVEVLVIGGGGGGSGLAGGGGGGGYVYQSSFNVVAGLGYPVVVGTGGTGSTTHTNNTATSGNPSYFGQPQNQIVGYGGGQGAHWYSPNTGQTPVSNANGGSGGGGPGYGYAPGTRPSGAGVIGQGHPGGWGHHGGGPATTQASYPQPGICVYGGGGGGGAGQRGFDRQNVFFEAKGGDGMVSTIANSGQTFYAAGGGGGSHGPSGNYGRDQSTGGQGGGGQSYSSGPSAIQPANPTSIGSGGAGQWHPDTFNSGNGSNGIVIVRYRN